ncbi:MAG: hypothetical protein AB1641_22480 [Thermodesulfobacteriota bacterium]
MKVTPPPPKNVGKKRKIVGIDGQAMTLRIEDEIVRPQRNAKFPKLIYFQKLRFEEDDRLEYRFTYYMLGQKPGARGRWVFGQYSLMIPAADLRELLIEARLRGWEGV